MFEVDGGSGGAVAVVDAVGSAVAAEEEEAWSGLSRNCLNLLKYRSEANSVMWRGSMISYVWRLCHPIAGVSAVVIDKAYQGREGHSSKADLERCANSAESSEIVVAHSMLMHHEM